MDVQDKNRIYDGTDVPEDADRTKPPAVREGDDFVELLKAMVFAALIAVFVRTFFFEPFNIPSGSMYPTLKVGDYLFVEKYSYGYSRYSFPLGLVNFDGRVMESHPARGDVAVFRQPKKPDIDYIKRIIGLPGDRIQVRDGVLHINDAPVQRELLGTEEINDGTIFMIYRKYAETLPNGVRHDIYEISDQQEYDETPEYTVPDGHYFAMGDNRDSSLDSRAQAHVGFVPAENLVGRASFLFYSTEGIDGKCQYEGTFAAVRAVGCKFIAWPKAIRYERLFRRVSKL